jgi:hypothetical protein
MRGVTARRNVMASRTEELRDVLRGVEVVDAPEYRQEPRVSVVPQTREASCIVVEHVHRHVIETATRALPKPTLSETKTVVLTVETLWRAFRIGFVVGVGLAMFSCGIFAHEVALMSRVLH